MRLTEKLNKSLINITSPHSTFKTHFSKVKHKSTSYLECCQHQGSLTALHSG